MKLTIQSITKKYQKTLAINHFSAEFTPGIYALLGPNGSGKSTLISILTENLSADSGEILYTNEQGVTKPIRELGDKYREKIGYMPQYPGLYPNFSVERFMWYIAALKGLTKAKAKEEISVALEAVGLEEKASCNIGSLSGGMKQRLALAQAVLGDPEILILDEPTAGLDPQQRIAIRTFISKIALKKIVLIATHVVSDIEFIAQKIIILRKGNAIANSSPEALISKLQNHVWVVNCNETVMQLYQNQYQVINIMRNENGTIQLRILSPHPPENTAISTSPTLEDYYLWVFGSKAADDAQ